MNWLVMCNAIVNASGMIETHESLLVCLENFHVYPDHLDASVTPLVEKIVIDFRPQQFNCFAPPITFQF